MTLEDYMEKGTVAIARGELDEAAICFKKATEIGPECFEAWHSLGMAYMKLQKYPEAIEAGEKAVKLKPQDQLAHVSLSIYFQRNGQIAEAEAESAKAKVLGWGGKLSSATF